MSLPLLISCERCGQRQDTARAAFERGARAVKLVDASSRMTQSNPRLLEFFAVSRRLLRVDVTVYAVYRSRAIDIF